MENIIVSGKPLIIVRAGSNFTFNGIKYQENQILGMTKDCNVEFFYRQIDKSMSVANKTLGSTSNAALDRVIVSSFPLNSLITNLFFSKDGNNKKSETIIRTMEIDENGIIALPTRIPENLMIQNTDYQILSYERLGDGIYKVNDAAPGTTVFVSYTATVNGFTLSADGAACPYVKLECIATGYKLEPGTKRMPLKQQIKIKRAALSVNPTFIFDNTVSNFDIEFKVVSDKETSIEYLEIPYGK